MSRRTLVLGLGNSVRSDDGVGLAVVERLRSEPLPSGVALESAGTCGLGILDLVVGFERLVLVDAIDIGRPPGTVLELELDDLQRTMPLHCASSHDADLDAALAAGRRLGLDLPEEVIIVAVQVADTVTLAERLTPAVAAAVDEAVEALRRLID